MGNDVIIDFIKEKNELLFRATLQSFFDSYSSTHNIEVQYQHIVEKYSRGDDTFYTALVIARRR